MTRRIVLAPGTLTRQVLLHLNRRLRPDCTPEPDHSFVELTPAGSDIQEAIKSLEGVEELTWGSHCVAVRRAIACTREEVIPRVVEAIIALDSPEVEIAVITTTDDPVRYQPYSPELLAELIRQLPSD